MTNKILLIDDDRDLLVLLVAAFKARGYEVQGISNGEEALQFFSDKKNLNKVSLIILDRLLPDMDGLEILKNLHEKQLQIPVLIMSVLSSDSEVQKGYNCGAIDYLSKPFSISILISKAIALLSLRK